ncbi:hypothetical protein HYDPIDRAFT_40904 [Hydnomerulius pinastri MD-312]|uniref:Steroid 5-alpha reductase C-terminal domain-containing protein n=1 Tax=Hydnomerulius pinastri MD-312 TaxID=994086 RepID=A0A0C9VYM7_9AGAM|nr:hypothetical protein HYDPIDRAFT_40904 [Hydnomerulius pinastri MD-312]
MAPIVVLDQYYLAITLLVTIGYQLLGFAIAWTFKFDKITDFTGGSNFLILALMTLLLGQNFCGRNVAASYFVMVWAARLGAFLLMRVLKRGSDSRFDEIRSHFFKFLGFWVGQIVWVWIVSLPITILNSPAVTGVNHNRCNPVFGTSRDIAGVIVWGIGLAIETVADLQKFEWKSLGPPPYAIMDTGLWRWSRHPPYFGEILCWWGIWMLTLSPTTDGLVSSSAWGAQYGAVASPIFTLLLLMFASGIPTSESSQARKFYDLGQEHDAGDDRTKYPSPFLRYQAYLSTTSILIPIPRSVYWRIPNIIKSTVLLDFSMYRTFKVKKGDEENKRRAELI